jgi:glycosyltransferase involved in cell wall biosynthesis
MLTAIIPTHNSERALVPTLAMLVPGAMSGTVRDVIVVDGGSTDATAEVVEIAGCELMRPAGPLGTRLKTAAAAARGTWLLFLRPGVVFDAAWVEEATRVIENAVARGTAASHAAVFRRSAAPEISGSFFRQLVDLFASALRGPHPDQGLILSRQFYDHLGGHRADVVDPETELLRRIGRRRIITLRSGAVGWRGQDG